MADNEGAISAEDVLELLRCAQVNLSGGPGPIFAFGLLQLAEAIKALEAISEG